MGLEPTPIPSAISRTRSPEPHARTSPARIPLALAALAATLAACEPGQAGPPLRPRAAASARATSLPIPATPGNGPAVKAVCCNASNFGGGDPLSQAAALVNGYTALQVPAAPPTSLSVASWTLGQPIDFSSGDDATANGLFSVNLDPGRIFGSQKNNWAGLFAGYIKIDPSSDGTMVQKTFVVASDDGFRFSISDGTNDNTMDCDQGRAMTTNFLGTNYYAGCGNPFGQSTLTVTFPAAGGLFPFDLLYFQITGDQGLELSWVAGQEGAPEANALNGYTLVPADHIYAPAVQATMTVSDANATVQPGDTLTYSVQITNTGNAPLSSYTFAVKVDTTRLTGLAGGMGGSCSNSAGLLVCPLATVLNPGDSTGGTFTAQVAAGLASGTVIDVQGVVTGLATTTDVANAVGGAGEQTAGEIYALTDDPNVVAGSNFQTIDTGNTPVGFAATMALGLADDDATRVVVGQAPEAPPVITGPPNPSSSDALLTVTGTSHAPAGVAVQVQLSGPSAAPTLSCNATTASNGSWSCPAYAFIDGSYSATARLLDSAGFAGPKSANYAFVVNAPAAPAITAPTSGQAVHSSNVVFSGTSGEANGQTVRVTVQYSNASTTAVCNATVQSGQWSCAISLPDGGYTATAAVIEVSLDLGSSSAALPFTVATGGACGSTLAQTPSPTNVKRPAFSGTATSGDALQVCSGGSTPCGAGSTPLCSVTSVGSGGTWQCSPGSDLADGVYTVVAVASGGNVVCPSNSDVFTIDTVPPPAPVFTAPVSPTSQTKPTFSGTGVPGDTVQVSDAHGELCSATVAQNGTWSCAPSAALSDGSYALTAIQIDLAGNQSPSATQTVVVNTSKPNTPTLSGPASPTRNPILPFSGQSDVGTAVTVRDSSSDTICTSGAVTGASANASSGTWSCSSGHLSDGSYTFTAIAESATNVASNPSLAITIVVDTTPPAAPVLDAVPSPTAQHFPLFSGSAEAGAQVAVFEGTTPLCSGPSVGNFSCVSTVSLANGVHTVTADATDAAGNVSTMSAPVTFTVDDTIAPAPTLAPLPTPPGGQPGFTAQVQPTFGGTGVPGDLVTARLVGSVALCTATVAGDGSWSCASTTALTGQPATAYSVEAVQQAPAGTHALSPPSAPIQFTVDTHVPETPELDPPASPSSARTPTFTGSAEALDDVEVDDAQAGALCTTSADAQGNFGCAPAQALADGTYQLTARSFSRAGISSATSTPARTLTIFTAAALPAPTIDQPVSPTRNSKPTLSGTASAGATVAVRAGSQAICSSLISGGKWSCAPATALADGTYVLTARASDASGNSSADSPSVALVIDTRAPAAPVIVAPAAGSELDDPVVTASGTAQVATRVALTLDGNDAGSTAAAADGSWTLALGSLALGVHTLTATATDAAGNVSAAAQVTFSITLAGTVRGGCTSGGLPMPLVALATLLFFWPRRRRAAARARARTCNLAAPSSRVAPSRFAAGLFLAVLLAAPLARAQQLDLGRLQPPSDGEGLLGVEGARPPVEGDPRASVNLWLDNAFQPLVFQANSGARDVLIDNRVESFLGVQLHLWRPLSLAVQLPFLLAQTGDLSTLPPSAQPAGSLGGGVGDLRLTPRLAILRQETAPIDLGAQVSLTLPTASSAAYTGDTRVQFEMLAALARDLYLGNHAFELLGNVLVRLRAPEQIVDVKTGNELGARLGFAWLLDRSWVAVPRRLFVEAEGESALRGSFADGTVPAEWRVGASFCAAQAVSLDLGAGTALGDGIGAPRARVIFGLGYAPEACGQAGRDRFAARAHGAAPPTAALAVGDSSASPDAPTAHVATVTHVETSAAAPNTSNASHGEAPAAATANSPTSASRAPASNPEAFIAAPPASAPPTAAPPADALALPDIDALPAPPLPALVPAPGKSAPAAAAESDALPLTPLVALNDLHPAIAAPLAASGPDRDGDGLGDSFDSCPDQAGPVANHGCPSGAAMQVGIAADRLTLDSRLEFRSGSSALERSSLALLQQLAAVLKSHPEITHLEIRAHTGGAIPEARALALSQERAETVVKFLGGQGISFDRLSAVGLGSTQPIAPNLTAQGRKKNERIELLIGK